MALKHLPFSYYEGTIFVVSKDVGDVLKGMGITIGHYDNLDKSFSNCRVPIEKLGELGRYEDDGHVTSMWLSPHDVN